MLTDRWQTILAIDFDRWAAETYRANFPGVEVRCASVADEVERLPYADVILGGPPCQPFSTAGEGKGHEDARDCIPDFIAAVERVKPRMFLMENVPGLLNDRHAAYRGRIWHGMESAGYRVDARELDAVNFGVPQFRNRVWFWGIRSDVYAKGVRHAWPKPTHAWPPPEPCMFGGALPAAVTVGQALGLHGVLREERGRGITERHGARPDHPTTEPAPLIAAGSAGSGPRLQVIEYRYSDKMLAKHPPASPDKPSPTVMAKWFKTGAEGLLRIDGATGYNGQRVLNEGTPSPTLSVCNGNAELIPDDNATGNLRCQGLKVRRLTPLECLRLQSGPDDFRWPEGITKTAMYRVVGNGWACGMGAHMSRALAAADPKSRTVIDLFCGGGLGACGWHQRYWTYAPAGAGEEVA